jgi:membrane-associated phospholipid phosphatase
LIIPLFISFARVGVNDHWCSDVLDSVALAAAITLFFIWLFRMKPPQSIELRLAKLTQERVEP